MSAFDYVIVGGGTAGCVLAARLSEDPTSRVLLLEAGRGAGGLTVRAPAAFSRLFKTDRDWDLATTEQGPLEDRRLYWPRGKMLGGCSSMNAMMVVRGHPMDYDGWRDLGCAGWGFRDVLPYFKRSEDWTRGPDAFRGGGGPLTVTDLRQLQPVTRRFIQAAVAAGVPFNNDVNGRIHEGVGPTQVNQRGGERWSVVDAYLDPARRRPNLEVRTRTQVTRVMIAEGRAVGVEYRVGESRHRVRASREVVVSAGAVGSPHLLHLSGVGPGPTLQALGVGVVVDAPAVGEHLQDHLACGVLTRTHGVKTLARADSPWSLLKYLLTRRGPLASNVAEACGFVRSGPHLDAPDLELIFAPADFADHGLQRIEGDCVTVGAVLLQPESRGRITTIHPDASVPPEIDPRYLSDSDGADLRILMEGVRWARRVLEQPPLVGCVGPPIRPAGALETDEALAEFVRGAAETLYHPVGTCRMGKDQSSVLTPDLRVRGVDAMRVVDASVMPRIIRGHPHWPVIMLAERAADLILSDR